jgi:hypothetical protein
VKPMANHDKPRLDEVGVKSRKLVLGQSKTDEEVGGVLILPPYRRLSTPCPPTT